MKKLDKKLNEVKEDKIKIYEYNSATSDNKPYKVTVELKNNRNPDCLASIIYTMTDKKTGSKLYDVFFLKDKKSCKQVIDFLKNLIKE